MGALILDDLPGQLRAWGQALGFAEVAIAPLELGEASAHLARWLAAGYHGDMDFMARHAHLRADPALLSPGAIRAVMVRMAFAPNSTVARAALDAPERAVISHYALGRDYHKVLRPRLQKLADRLASVAGPHGFRVFTDSAPVFEVALARAAGLGWKGKHSLLLSREGSWWFLGGFYTNLPLPVAPATEVDHCGRCRRCIDACPTQAIIAPYTVDARRCISYLTIELHGSIPEPLRPLIGNHIYGCDDCQLACPWNLFSRQNADPDFSPRHGLDQAELTNLMRWDATTFEQRMAGSPIRRIGYERWLRNIAVALGNGPATTGAQATLATYRDHPSPLVREHVAWALARLAANQPPSN